MESEGDDDSRSQWEDWTPMKFTYCFVPTCKNTTTKGKSKRFFKVPFTNRKAWCQAVGRSDVPTSSISVCEDHLQLEDDMENYLKWKYVSCRPKLKTRVPAKLLALNFPQASASKQPDNEHRFLQNNIEHSHTQVKLLTQNNISEGVQVSVKMIDCGVNTTGRKRSYKVMLQEDICSLAESIPSVMGSTTEVSEYECTDTANEDQCHNTSQVNFLPILENKTYQYLGVPENFFWLLNFISNDSKVPKLHLIIVLYKLRHGDPFYKISDLFNISLTTLWRTFPKTLDMLASIFSKFIYWPSASDIKRNLPMSFKTKKDFANTQSIIDCFEIEIEKPNKPIEQSSTWSQYKNCNTIKFLISATPDGFINFISKGYGGRISDMKLVEISGFLDVVKPNSIVLADRGFKHLDSVLQRKSVKLLRPPSVYANVKLTKSEAIEAKVIASLRIHIERVIRRVRMFKFLKPHSTINNKLVTCVDDAVVVACGLINLQSPIVNS